MHADRYYRHSGRFSLFSVAKALMLGLLASVPMAFVYAYLIVYIPIIGVVTFLLTGGFAAVVGLAVGSALAAGKVRNTVAAVLTALPVALFALWASWVVWVYALLHRVDSKIALVDLTLEPAALVQIIQIINAKGAWSFKGAIPTGGILWAMWAGEAAIIVGVIIALGVQMVSSPFCESCDRWCEEHKAIGVLGATDKGALAPRLERGDYSVLRELGEATELAYTQLDLHLCGQCQATAALSATSVTVSSKKGKQEKNEKTLFSHLLLSPGDLATVKTILADTRAPEGGAPEAG